MDRVLTDWQKAVNAIAHALNKAGYDGDSPESKALELLAGRCESLTDSAWEIERLRDVLQQQMKNVGELKQYLHNTRSELDKVKGDKDGAYTERNRLVAFIASLFPSQQCKTNIEGWDPEWHGCVFIETPAGQLSWHFHDSDAGLFDHVPYGSPVWDGHTTPEKYERVKSLINIRALTDSPAEIERLNGELNSLSESFGAVSEDYSNAQQEIERLRAKIDRFKEILQRADSFCSLVYHRYSRSAIPEDVREDLAKISKDSRAALSGGAEKEGER